MNHYSIHKTRLLGDLLLTADATHLTGLYFLDCEHAPAVENAPVKDWLLNPQHPVFQQAREQLEEYFRGERTTFAIPVRSRGTDFQQSVWREIAQIAHGQTITYSELARRAGKPDAIRAAGTATGRNPIGIIIPCHRVVGKNGSFGGYAGGLERKQRLLDLEQPPGRTELFSPRLLAVDD